MSVCLGSELVEWLFGPKRDRQSFREVCTLIFPGTVVGQQGQSEVEVTLTEEAGHL